jgi:hypothetical protein
MALSRYVITSTVTVPAGAAAAPAAGEPGTGGQAGYGSGATAGVSLYGAAYQAGTPVVLDPAGGLYAAIGAGNLRAWIDGQDTVSHAAISN